MPQLFWLLQVLGDSLSTGWPSILAVLEASATRNEADAGRVVRLGHECLEVVVADFLPLLPRPLLRRALHIEACFVMQVRHACLSCMQCHAPLPPMFPIIFHCAMLRFLAPHGAEPVDYS